jgi:thiol-disulfide isomerase/thioredoxin
MPRSVIAVAFVCGALIFGSIAYQRRSHAIPDAWQEGAGGYQTASRLATERGAPLLVYFHTEWCGYCKQMERDLFPKTPKLREVVKVRLDPERSSEEQQLAYRYGVHGYPSLFLERGGGGARRLMPFRQINGGWSQVSPEEFADQLR